MKIFLSILLFGFANLVHVCDECDKITAHGRELQCGPLFRNSANLGAQLEVVAETAQR